MFYTYVLKCDNLAKIKAIFYVGSTTDLKNRLKEHKTGKVKTTKIYNKIELIYYEACLNKQVL